MKCKKTSRVAIVIAICVIALGGYSFASAQRINPDLASPEIVLVKPDKAFTTALDTVVFEGIILSYKLPLTEVTFYENDVVLFRKKPEPQLAFRYPFNVRVKLQPGNNSVMIMARNEKGQSKVAVGPIVFNGGGTNSRKPSLIVLGISTGPVKEMPGPRGSAETDVDQFVAQLKEGSSCLFETTKVKVLKGAEATRSGILGAFGWMSRESQSDADVKIVFIRGPSFRSESGAYFLASTDHTSNAEAEFNDAAYELILKRLNSSPGRSILLLDGYLSGVYQFEAMSRQTSAPLGNVTAIVNSYSTKSTEPSIESSFTTALLEGLAGKADKSANRRIDVEELYAWLLRRLPELNKTKQAPVLWRDSSGLKPVEFYCFK